MIVEHAPARHSINVREICDATDLVENLFIVVRGHIRESAGRPYECSGNYSVRILRRVDWFVYEKSRAMGVTGPFGAM